MARVANHPSRACEDPWGPALKTPIHSSQDQDLRCSFDFGGCPSPALSHGAKSVWPSGFKSYKSSARGSLWWLMLTVLAAILTVYFSGARLFARKEGLLGPRPPKDECVAESALGDGGTTAAVKELSRGVGGGGSGHLNAASPNSQVPGPRPSSHGVDIFFQGEFGFELIAVLPFAYWLHLNGSLRSTTSCGRQSLAFLYYFSSNHTNDATCQRDKKKNHVAPYGFCGGIHAGRIPPAWQAPPLAEHFRQFPSVWPEIPKGSRLVVIGNKFEMEWAEAPANFIDLPTLIRIVDSYIAAGFYVVYNRPGMSVEADPWQIVKGGKDLGDYEALEERYGQNQRFQVMQNVQKRWLDLEFNDVQFRMMARSVCFVSVQGGGSIVESFFGGRNLIFFRKGHELKAGAYENVYPRLSGAIIEVITSYEALEGKVDEMIQKHDCYAQV